MVAVINFDARTELGFRSVEWEATRVGDVIGAKSWWRAKGRFSAAAFASRTTWHGRLRTRATARAVNYGAWRNSQPPSRLLSHQASRFGRRRHRRTTRSPSLSIGARGIHGGL